MFLGSIPKWTETISGFVETEKTDIRYAISYFGQSQFFEVQEYPKVCVNLQTGKSILHQFEGLHKLWDTPNKSIIIGILVFSILVSYSTDKKLCSNIGHKNGAVAL